MTKKSTEQDTLLEGVTGAKEAPKATKKNGKDENVGYIENETLPAVTDLSEVVPSEPLSGMALEIANERAAWGLIKSQAQVFLRSGALPKDYKNVEQVMVAISAGREVGMKPWVAVNSSAFVNGRHSFWGKAVIAQVIRAGHHITWGKCNADEATITIVRGDTGEPMDVTVTMKDCDARKVNVDRDGKKLATWTKFPSIMLRFKAFHECAKFHVPDALEGIEVTEELQGRGYVEGLNEPQEIEIESRPAEETAAPEGKLATPKAVKAFYLMANKAGWPEKEIKRAILQVTGKEEGDEVDLNNITETQLRDLIDMVEGI